MLTFQGVYNVPLDPKCPCKNEVFFFNPQYMAEITPKIEGNAGSMAVCIYDMTYIQL